MMISSSNDVEAKKQERENSASSSRQLFRNPRIVRVSRAFGGKDRHSKVCTVRGLRDRRIRLSVPTAIQLYDLQDKLGLNQPSKVIDWLIEATKNDIDKLPPLQLPRGGFPELLEPSTFAPLEQHGVKRTMVDKGESADHKGKCAKTIGVEDDNFAGFNSYPSNVALAQLGTHGFLTEAPISSSLVQSQLVFYNQPAAISSFFYTCPPFITMDTDPQDLPHFSLNMNHTHNQDGS